MRNDVKCTYTDSIAKTITGFRPRRSEAMPQKIEVMPLPIMYEAAAFGKTNKWINLNMRDISSIISLIINR
jgi:hypothetical protein